MALIQTIRLERPAALWVVPAVLAVGVACGAAATFAGPVYAVAGLLALLLGAAMLASVRLTGLAFIAATTLLPFGVVPIPIGGVRLTLIDVTLSLLLLTWVLRALARRDRRLVSTPADGPLIALVGVSITAFVFGTSHANSPETMRQFFKLVNSMLFFFTITQLVRTRRDLMLVAKFVIAGGAVAAAIGIALYHLPPDSAASLLRSLRPLGYPTGQVLRYVEDAGVRTTTLRAIGTSVDPNVFGALLVMTGGLALGRMLAVFRRPSGSDVMRTGGRWWLALATALIGYALLLTLSRGSWIGFAVAAALLMLVRYRRALWVVAAAIPVLIVLFGTRLAGFAEHFLNAVYARDQATGMRLGEYKDALNLIQQYPVLGVGFGSAPSADLYLGVSSSYLLVAEQMGVVGLAAYLAVIVTVVVVAIRAYRRGPEQIRPLTLAALAAFCGVVVSASFDHHYVNLRYQHVTALYWMLAAVVVLAARLPTAADEDSQPG